MFTLYHRFLFFFFNDTATTEIYTLSLHDALPIYHHHARPREPLRSVDDVLGNSADHRNERGERDRRNHKVVGDRKSTRLNSSHLVISYAVFCLKKKNNERGLDRNRIRLNEVCIHY